MKSLRVARAGSWAVAAAVVAVSAVSMAATAGADEPFLTVSGTVHCVDNAYTLTVPASKIQTGTTSFYFLDGASLANATRIGDEQPLQSGQDATATWTPSSSGEHKLWMRGIQSGAAVVVGPQAVDVVDAAPDGSSCAATGAGVNGLSSLSAG